MKKYFLFLTLFLLVACTTTKQPLKPFVPKQVPKGKAIVYIYTDLVDGRDAFNVITDGKYNFTLSETDYFEYQIPANPRYFWDKADNDKYVLIKGEEQKVYYIKYGYNGIELKMENIAKKELTGKNKK